MASEDGGEVGCLMHVCEFSNTNPMPTSALRRVSGVDRCVDEAPHFLMEMLLLSVRAMGGGLTTPGSASIDQGFSPGDC